MNILDHNEILVEIWCDCQEFVREYAASLGLINHLFDHLSYGDLKITLTDSQHFLLHFKDEQAFSRLIHFPVLSGSNLCQKISELQHHYLGNLFFSHKFPHEGLTINFIIREGDIPTILTLMQKCYQSIHPGVDIVQNTADAGFILIASPDAFQQYTVLLFTLIQQRMSGLV